MDARTLALKQVFGEATHSRVIYYLIPDLWDDQIWCSGGAACAVENHVYAQGVPIEHELTHAIRRERLPVVFEEGLAEVFGDLGWTSEPASRDRLLEILEASDPVDKADYARAGHFVAFLIETYGMEALDRFALAGNLHDDYARVRRAFESSFGVTLEQALDVYSDYPECDSSAWMDRHIACEQPAIPLTPGVGIEVGVDIDLECSEADVIGPHGGFMFVERTLEITPDFPGLSAWILLVGDVSPDSIALLVSCDTSCADSTVVGLDGEFAGEFVELPAGRYVLRLFRPVDDPGTLGITVRQ